MASKTKSLHKILMMVGMVALLGSVAFVGLRFVSPPDRPDTGPGAGDRIPDLDLTQYKPILATTVATNLGGTAWVSEERAPCANKEYHEAYIKPGAAVCPFCRAEQPNPDIIDSDEDGIYDAMEDKHGLDKLFAEDAYADPDGDLFPNVEEVGIKVERPTDPNDAASHPPYADHLCLSGIQERPFQITFQGVTRLTETNLVFNLQFKALNDTWFAQLGEEKHGYKLLEYEEKIEELGPGQMLNKSEVTIQVLASGEKIKLPFNKEINNSRRLAKVVFVRDPSVQIPVLKKDAKFAIREVEFQVTAIAKDRMQVRRLSDGKLITIVPCNAAQKMEFQGRRDGSWVPGGGFDIDPNGELLDSDGRRVLPPDMRTRGPGAL